MTRTPVDCMPRNEGLETTVQDPPCAGDALPDVVADLPALPYRRWSQRVKPPRDKRRIAWLLVLVLAGHALLGLVAYVILRPHIVPGRAGVFTVSLLEPAQNLPPPPPLLAPPPLPGQPPPPAAPPPRLHYVPPEKGAMSATLEGVKGPALQLYGANGQIRLPTAGAGKPAAAYSTPALQSSRIYSGKSPVQYKPTRFAKDFAPTNQNIVRKTVGRALDKAIDKTTIKKTIRLPGGIKIRCAVNPLLALAGGLLGCGGEPPQPPPKNDDDIRLSMPPAETLTGKKVVVPGVTTSVGAPPASGTH